MHMKISAITVQSTCRMTVSFFWGGGGQFTQKHFAFILIEGEIYIKFQWKKKWKRKRGRECLNGWFQRVLFHFGDNFCAVIIVRWKWATLRVHLSSFSSSQASRSEWFVLKSTCPTNGITSTTILARQTVCVDESFFPWNKLLYSLVVSSYASV